MLIQQTATASFFTLINLWLYFVRTTVVTSILLLQVIYTVFCYQLAQVTEALNTLQIHAGVCAVSIYFFFCATYLDFISVAPLFLENFALIPINFQSNCYHC